MKLKSTLLVLLICLFFKVNAQSSSNSVYTYFYSPSNMSLQCGDRLINGRIYQNQNNNRNIVFGENNKYFLEIAAKGSTVYARTQAIKTDIQSTGTAQFLLPDTLKLGKSYLLRMVSTNPALISDTPYEIVFGNGKLPFDVSFKQEVSYFQHSNQAYLNFRVSQPNTQTSRYNESLSYSIKLSNGNSYQQSIYGMPYTSSFLVLPKDSINVYKIDEFVNNCGVKGNIDGDATVIKKSFVDKIYIKSVYSSRIICAGSKLNLDVESKSLTTNSKLKLEYSTDYNFSEDKITSIDVKIDNNQKVIVDIPSNVSLETWTYFRLVSDSPKMTSNRLDFLFKPKPSSITPYLTTSQNNNLLIYFNHFVNNNSNYNGPIVEAVVNGTKLTQSDLTEGSWTFPMPKKDTVFTFSKIVSSCGEIPINQSRIVVQPNNFVTIELETNQKEVCQGQSVVYNYKSSNPAKNNSIRFFAYIQAYGRDMNIANTPYVFANTSNLQTIVDQENKSVTIKIPTNINEQLLSQFKTNNLLLEEVYLSIYASSNDFNLRVNSTSSIRTQINLNPVVSLTTPSITAEKPGYINLPVKFSGGPTINYKLSNGQEGSINHTRPDCNSCSSVFGNSNFIRILAQKNETIKFTSVENACAIGSVSGETKIVLDETKPSLIIDESKILKAICRGSNIDIPFLKTGNWPEKNTFKIYTRTYYNDNSIKNTTTVVSESEKLQIKASTNESEYFFDVWIESNGSVSNTVRIALESKPNNLSFTTNQVSSSSVFDDNTEIISVPNAYSQTYFQFNGYGSNLIFTVNGKQNKPTYQSLSYSSYSDYIKNSSKDTTLTFNSVSNSCGVVEVNKKYKIVGVPTVIFSFEDNAKNFLPVSPCAGSKRVTEFQYYGKIPEKDSLVVQLAKYSQKNPLPLESNKLRFFDVPTTRQKQTLIYTLPDTLSGEYVYRIKSLTSNINSNFNYLSYTIQQKPSVKLTAKNNKNEVIGIPGASLYLDTKPDQNSTFYVTLNNGQTYSNFEFGLYYDYIRSENSNDYKMQLQNYGKYFTPFTTTNYSIKSVFNQCGEGKSEGNVTIVVQPAVRQQFSNTSLSNTYCNGDSISLDLSYYGTFPKDTLMGLYLHTTAKASYNLELTTFKNNPKKISVKLPTDINSGYYFLQIRKKSRSMIYKSGKNMSYDSLQYVQAKLNLDSDISFLSIASAPNIALSGSTEIFVGNSATLYIEPLNQKGENFATSKDTISLVGGMDYHYQLSNGNKYSSNSQNFSLSPLKTETFSITSIKSACGEGKAVGSATIIVLPKSDKRIETVGYFRNKGNYDSYYSNYQDFCAGTKDSIDIKVFGKDLNIQKYFVVLSDISGNNYTAVKTEKTSIITDSLTYKMIRLWFQLPENLATGKTYRIKGVSEDNSILSTPLVNPLSIIELPTASLVGNTQFINGEKVNALVKLTGDAPWLISVKDKDGNFVYNGLPTKIDSTEKFKNYEPKLIYTNELKLELNPEKSNVYKVTDVFNVACGLGKVIAGELSVNLVLANENPNNTHIQIFPNPTVNQLNIDLKSLNATTLVEIFDQVGKLLDSKSFNQDQIQQNQSLDFSQYNSGVYIIKVNSDKFSQTYRVVKH
ncbi:MAG: T9SS type A sorting domain-containing protein [Emticicia sp.]|uniref:T9SS type A sorting domain-containing protein n=1 Tax=Emticicia sp. TaxID=1930953 RepID=UPI003BA41913